MALLGLLAAGGALRIWLMHTWRPAFMGYPDAGGYVYSAFASGRGHLFYSQYRPAGAARIPRSSSLCCLIASQVAGMRNSLAFRAICWFCSI